MLKFNTNQLKYLKSLHANTPVQLKNIKTVDLSNYTSFVYDRVYGLIECPAGTHTKIMAFLYCIAEGIKFDDTTFTDYYKYADRFILNLEGTCYKSSVTKAIQSMNLDDYERDKFSSAGFDINELYIY